ncbi:hypothetical protein L207DRAFT_531203 [Hyaloscypha variabilis F]|uniref:Uncharacterized protein n=1 Tax=Hyaloscypha variabilis (strain UAMH 11265 / GT02V1 / F) TaxID=1149755 RepID=A0A2J6RIF4_HYAVF|nr:hypothetical protein L207DRAFT_531203 [Hyaloscypha variabilis F]
MSCLPSILGGGCGCGRVAALLFLAAFTSAAALVPLTVHVKAHWKTFAASQRPAASASAGVWAIRSTEVLIVRSEKEGHNKTTAPLARSPWSSTKYDRGDDTTSLPAPASLLLRTFQKSTPDKPVAPCARFWDSSVSKLDT